MRYYQQLATAVLIHVGRVMGYTKARALTVETTKKLVLVSFFYNANVAFALASLKGVNIPMYIAIKRLTPLAVLIAGFFTGKGKPTTQVIGCSLRLNLDIDLFCFLHIFPFYLSSISSLWLCPRPSGMSLYVLL